ncbi:MAG: hypothetical protein ABH877_00485, partial [bacterium]
MRKGLALTASAAAFAFLLFSTGGFAAPEAFTVTHLSANGAADYYPQVSGDRVVWYGYGGTDEGHDTEIFMWTPAEGAVQLTTNGAADYYP